MKANAAAKNKNNLILSLHPLQRILLSLAASGVTFLLLYKLKLNGILMSAILWLVFATSFNITSWIIFFKMPIPEIVKKANKEDGSRLFVLTSILLSSFASMIIVLQLVLAKEKFAGNEIITLLVSIVGIISSWVLVHTIFTFHYAHLYYFQQKDSTPGSEVLDFPGKSKPGYLDFAYFSFVIGMTFQVSDVEVCSPSMRRTVLMHGLLSFALNTFVVALTINLIAGMRQ